MLRGKRYSHDVHSLIFCMKIFHAFKIRECYNNMSLKMEVWLKRWAGLSYRFWVAGFELPSLIFCEIASVPAAGQTEPFRHSCSHVLLCIKNVWDEKMVATFYLRCMHAHELEWWRMEESFVQNPSFVRDRLKGRRMDDNKWVEGYTTVAGRREEWWCWWWF